MNCPGLCARGLVSRKDGLSMVCCSRCTLPRGAAVPCSADHAEADGTRLCFGLYGQAGTG